MDILLSTHDEDIFNLSVGNKNAQKHEEINQYSPTTPPIFLLFGLS